MGSLPACCYVKVSEGTCPQVLISNETPSYSGMSSPYDLVVLI